MLHFIVTNVTAGLLVFLEQEAQKLVFALSHYLSSQQLRARYSLSKVIYLKVMTSIFSLSLPSVTLSLITFAAGVSLSPSRMNKKIFSLQDSHRSLYTRHAKRDILTYSSPLP